MSEILQSNIRKTIDCANCKTILEDENEIYAEINAFVTSGEMESSNISVIDALAYIYQIEWKELFTHLTPDGDRTANGGTLKVLLCTQCGELLSCLYKSFSNFEKFANVESLLKKAKEFRFQNKTKSKYSGTLSSKKSNPEEEELFDRFNFDLEGHSDANDEGSECKFDPAKSAIPNLFLISNFPDSKSKSNNSPPGMRLIVKLEKLPEDQVIKLRKEVRVRQKNSKGLSSSKSRTPGGVRVKRRRNAQFLGSHKCTTCGKEFNSGKNLWKHKQIHRSDRFTQCDICGKVLSSVKYLPKHRLIHENDRAENCSICGKILASKEAVKTHMSRVHISDTEKEMRKKPCKICGKPIFSDNKSHILSHEVRKELKCDKCTKVFYSQARLDLHMEAHSSSSIFKCRACGKEFPLQIFLDEHHERQHKVEKPYACDQCPLRFTLKSNLVRHLATHTADRPFVCEECGSTFRNQRHLKMHIQSHRDEELGPQAFQCQHCSKFLRNSRSLYIHTSKFHRSDLVVSKRIHECTICGRRLFDEKNLKKHYMAVHKYIQV